MDAKKIADSALKYALHNAVKYSGKANPGAVIGKIIAEFPDVKSDMKSASNIINDAIKDVNAMKPAAQLKMLEEIAPELLEEKHEEQKAELKELHNAVKGKVVMRFAPSPSGPLHIGHAYVGSLNSEYVRKYNGTLIIRIEDTNADNIYVPAYELIPEDARWMWGDKIKVFVQSDRMDIYYSYCLMMIEEKNAYVCSCSQDEFKRYKERRENCPCRNLDIKKQIERWKLMFDPKKTDEGDFVVRFKTSMQDKNPAMRDFPIFRINDSEHPRTGKKYRVWPLMNFSVAIDDLEMGITHSIRGKDHMDNAKKQELMHNALKVKTPESIFVGRINFEGLEVSCSKTRQLIDDGKYSGWDDIRVPFMRALKRRGYQPETFVRYAVTIGTSQADKTVSGEEFFKIIDAFNKDIVDPKAYRFFFVQDPVKIRIEGIKKKITKITLDLHPDNRKSGRKLDIGSEFYIEKRDFDALKDKEIVRLMDCLNFRKNGKDFDFDSEEYEVFRESGKRIIHWLPADESQLIEAEVLMPDSTSVKGYIEKTAEMLKIGDVCQLERHGFCRLDSKEKGGRREKLIFWFAHR